MWRDERVGKCGGMRGWASVEGGEGGASVEG